MQLTPALLRAATGCTAEAAERFAPHLAAACDAYLINTPARLAAFLAQIGHESGSLRHVREVWGPTDAQRRYEGRADLGNTQPGDGKRFMGRGLIQTTGRHNYRAVRDRLRQRGHDAPDFEADPEALESPKWAAWSAADYWDWRRLNPMADVGRFLAIGRAINRGNPMASLPANGEDDRVQRHAVALKAVGSVSVPAPMPAAPPPPLVQPGPEPADYHAPAGEAPDWVPPPPKGPTMAPFIAAALPALIQHAPALIRVFGDSPQAERNAKAAEVVADIAMRATGTDTAEGAVRAIEARPEAAAAYREAVHQSLPELLSLMARATEIDEKTRASALDRNLQLGQATGGRWLWLLGSVVIIVIVASYAITAAVLFREGFTPETKALLLGQIVIFGFVTVLAWLFGSNIANRLSQQANLTKGQQ